MSASVLPPSQASAPHIPVLLAEVLAALAIVPGMVIVDATFGAGGYTRAFLDAGATVHAFDRDPDAVAAVAGNPHLWPEAGFDPPRLIVYPQCFSGMAAALGRAGVDHVDGIAMDIGVSSMQLDQAERGFAFQLSGPLDMRMSQQGESAADFLNTAPENAIADVLYHYGEERQSRRVARAIMAARPLQTTGDLASVVRRVLGYRPGATKDPATRTFQAIRIHVNGELAELSAALAAAEALLASGGRLAVVSFHSLEDRIVKHFLRDANGVSAAASRHLPVQNVPVPAVFTGTGKVIRPSAREIATNPRARSACLRMATRTSAPARERKAA